MVTCLGMFEDIYQKFKCAYFLTPTYYCRNLPFSHICKSPPKCLHNNIDFIFIYTLPIFTLPNESNGSID